VDTLKGVKERRIFLPCSNPSIQDSSFEFNAECSTNMIERKRK